ncbi:ankyrin repeat domain-containing protein 50-like [Planoprotostelium fungivorum]|uniref:Ankyrin repeat domain-containing protein 50-like n=1 Tax=Planoprotostelium fungivorum TaxID=1890364 RepID=A0A2P6N0J8_9EUKA|nr:ankyrin repeat domain-containing protein 50-like [Planoprotostelium fungivorum]
MTCYSCLIVVSIHQQQDGSHQKTRQPSRVHHLEAIAPQLSYFLPIAVWIHQQRAIIERLLLAHPLADPSAEDNHTVQYAAVNGYVLLVQALLADARVDPTAENNKAIRGASKHGHTEIVRLLLAHPDKDNKASLHGTLSQDNWAIRRAAASGHHNIVELLLSDPRVNPSANDNEAIIEAASYGRTEEAVKGTSLAGHAMTVKLLLSDPRVDPVSYM